MALLCRIHGNGAIVNRRARTAARPLAIRDLDFATGFANGSPIRQVLAERGTDPEALVRELTPRLIALGGDAPFTPELAAIVISAIR